MSISLPQTRTVEEIQERICSKYGITLEEMKGPRRPNHIAHPRMVAMYLCRKMTNLSLEEIGRRFGNRDHGTVIHACKRVQAGLGPEQKMRFLNQFSERESQRLRYGEMTNQKQN